MDDPGAHGWTEESLVEAIESAQKWKKLMRKNYASARQQVDLLEKYLFRYRYLRDGEQ